MALLVGVLLLALDVLALLNCGRNQGTVEQQHVDPRHPFDG